MSAAPPQGTDDLDHPITPAAARGAEPLPPVAVHPHMVYGSGLTDPLDFLVLLHALFRAARGIPFKLADILEDLRAEGIRSSNGKGSGLVGEKAVKSSFRRLITAGFVRRTQANESGAFGEVRYELYQHPEYNPDWPPSGPQSLTGIPDDPDNPGENSITAAQAGSPDRASAHRASAHRPPGPGDETAGQTASPHRPTGTRIPPTPPLGEVNTSPNPHTHPAVPAGAVTREGEDSRSAPTNGHAPDRLAAAADFLSGLPEEVALNKKQREAIAPLLLERIDDDGWTLGPELLHALAKSDGSVVKNRTAVVRYRLKNLPPPPRTIRPRNAPDASVPDAERCPAHPGRPAAACPCQPPVDDRETVAPEDVQSRIAALKDLMGGTFSTEALAKERKARRSSRTRRGREAASQEKDAKFEEDRARYSQALAQWPPADPETATV